MSNILMRDVTMIVYFCTAKAQAKVGASKRDRNENIF